MICDNYRAVRLLLTRYRVLANILYVKLAPYAEEIIGENQRGFWRGDQQLIRFLLWGKYWKTVGNKKIELRGIFIDLQAAYDTVWRE